MKKIFFVLILMVLAIVFLVNGCQKETGCKKCSLNTYTNGTLTDKGDDVEYCDQELKDIENEEPTVMGNTKKQYDCQ
jgi:hypothetical protein